jgi:hypothetical protein
LTCQELKALEFDDKDPFRYELINVELVRKQPPAFKLQNIADNMLTRMAGRIQSRPGEDF